MCARAFACMPVPFGMRPSTRTICADPPAPSPAPCVQVVGSVRKIAHPSRGARCCSKGLRCIWLCGCSPPPPPPPPGFPGTIGVQLACMPSWSGHFVPLCCYACARRAHFGQMAKSAVQGWDVTDMYFFVRTTSRLHNSTSVGEIAGG